MYISKPLFTVSSLSCIKTPIDSSLSSAKRFLDDAELHTSSKKSELSEQASNIDEEVQIPKCPVSVILEQCRYDEGYIKKYMCDNIDTIDISSLKLLNTMDSSGKIKISLSSEFLNLKQAVRCMHLFQHLAGEVQIELSRSDTIDNSTCCRIYVMKEVMNLLKLAQGLMSVSIRDKHSTDLISNNESNSEVNLGAAVNHAEKKNDEGQDKSASSESDGSSVILMKSINHQDKGLKRKKSRSVTFQLSGYKSPSTCSAREKIQKSETSTSKATTLSNTPISTATASKTSRTTPIDDMINAVGENSENSRVQATVSLHLLLMAESITERGIDSLEKSLKLLAPDSLQKVPMQPNCTTEMKARLSLNCLLGSLHAQEISADQTSHRLILLSQMMNTVKVIIQNMADSEEVSLDDWKQYLAKFTDVSNRATQTDLQLFCKIDEEGDRLPNSSWSSLIRHLSVMSCRPLREGQIKLLEGTIAAGRLLWGLCHAAGCPHVLLLMASYGVTPTFLQSNSKQPALQNLRLQVKHFTLLKDIFTTIRQGLPIDSIMHCAPANLIAALNYCLRQTILPYMESCQQLPFIVRLSETESISVPNAIWAGLHSHEQRFSRISSFVQDLKAHGGQISQMDVSQTGFSSTQVICTADDEQLQSIISDFQKEANSIFDAVPFRYTLRSKYKINLQISGGASADNDIC